MSHFVEKLVSNKIIPVEDKDLYIYGIQQSLLILLNIITTILTGIILGMLWQSIFFMVAYIPLRSYAGGYHAGSKLSCYLLSIVMMVGALSGIRLIPWSSLICTTLIIVGWVIIWFLAPVDDRNKILDQTERRFFKKRTRIILSILTGLVVFFWLISLRAFSICIVMVIVVVSIMLLLGKIKNRIGG